MNEGLIDPGALGADRYPHLWNDDFIGIRILDAPWVHANGVRRPWPKQRGHRRQSVRPISPSISIARSGLSRPVPNTPVAGDLSSAQAWRRPRPRRRQHHRHGREKSRVAPPFDQSEITARERRGAYRRTDGEWKIMPPAATWLKGRGVSIRRQLRKPSQSGFESAGPGGPPAFARAARMSIGNTRAPLARVVFDHQI